MADHSSHQHPAHQPSDPPAPLRGQFPRWEAWRGVGGLLYGRLRKSSPPVVPAPRRPARHRQIPGSSPGRSEGFLGKIMASISWYN
jgi:hypothetical protein